MTKKLFVGNIAWEIGAEELKQAFSKFGEVVDAFVATDKYTGRSRGFGFVTFAKEEEGEKAKAEMQGFELGEERLMWMMRLKKKDKSMIKQKIMTKKLLPQKRVKIMRTIQKKEIMNKKF